jgi:hypothetical protein
VVVVKGEGEWLVRDGDGVRGRDLVSSDNDGDTIKGVDSSYRGRGREREGSVV